MARGPNQLGGACGQDNACGTLFCHANHCETPCSLFAPSTCGAGLVCELAVDTLGYCVVPPPAPEDPVVPDGGDPTGGDPDAQVGDEGVTVPGDDTGPTDPTGDAGANADTPGVAGPASPAQGSSDDGCAGGGQGTGGWLLLALLGVALGGRRRRLLA